jgi:prolipoprotein diacylglyceryl transferase
MSIPAFHVFLLGFLRWDPSPEIFTLPFIGIPLTWYGSLFAIGFFIGLNIFIRLFHSYLIAISSHEVDFVNTKKHCESMLIYIMIGTVVGARIGHLLFYEEWSLFLNDPLIFFRTWEGGLASHGGIIGVVIALYLFYIKNRKKYFQIKFLRFFDIFSIPTMFVCSLIRVGNFFNQEIIGVVTDKPWGIIFLHPADRMLPLPRHPVQLYESCFYFFVFVSSYFLFKKYAVRWKPGRIGGYVCIISFAFRFYIEGFKDELSNLMQGDHLLMMGQYLSLPMIAFGFVIFFGEKIFSKKWINADG